MQRSVLALGCALALASPALHAIDIGPLQLKGNFQYDNVFVDDAPAPIDDIDDWRRQRLALAGKLPAEGDFKFEYDFNAQAFTDAYLRFSVAGGKLTVGQFKIPFAAEFLASSSQLMFTENIVSASLFAPSRRAGVQYAYLGEGWAMQGAAYGQDLKQSGPDFGLAARGWLFGEHGEGRWHAALAATNESPQDNQVRFRMRPEIGSFGPSWVDGGRFVDADNLRRTGIEAGYQQGNFVTSGEWFHASADSDSQGRRSARGGYVQAAWTVHGAPRKYDPAAGLFVGPKGTEGLGQIELALRYSHANLPRVAGGEDGQSGFSAGANLQYGKHLRFMLNRHQPERSSDGADAELWTFRVAVGF